MNEQLFIFIFYFVTFNSLVLFENVSTYYEIPIIYRMAKLKGITSGPPSECGDEKPKDSKRSSKNCENKEDEKYIDYKGSFKFRCAY